MQTYVYFKIWVPIEALMVHCWPNVDVLELFACFKLLLRTVSGSLLKIKIYILQTGILITLQPKFFLIDYCLFTQFMCLGKYLHFSKCWVNRSEHKYMWPPPLPSNACPNSGNPPLLGSIKSSGPPPICTSPPPPLINDRSLSFAFVFTQIWMSIYLEHLHVMTCTIICFLEYLPSVGFP